MKKNVLITRREMEETGALFSIEGPGSDVHNSEVKVALDLANSPEYQGLVAALLTAQGPTQAVRVLTTMSELGQKFDATGGGSFGATKAFLKKLSGR